ncbi:MAG: hypothetical protein AVDCRST_MAG64-3957, partial [uncultured Phycisphaerae bacterium]
AGRSNPKCAGRTAGDREPLRLAAPRRRLRARAGRRRADPLLHAGEPVRAGTVRARPRAPRRRPRAERRERREQL